MAIKRRPVQEMKRRQNLARSGEAGAMAPGDYLIRAVLTGTDEAATAMERKWGMGRLRLLVSDELRARFDAQADKLDHAIRANSSEMVKRHGDAMRRAWQALDAAAVASGARPASLEMWECVMPSTGEVVGIVRDRMMVGPQPGMLVFTLEEIAKLIDGLPELLLATKREFEGSVVEDVRNKVDWSTGDDIPF